MQPREFLKTGAAAGLIIHSPAVEREAKGARDHPVRFSRA
jgi:hypothetical protein